MYFSGVLAVMGNEDEDVEEDATSVRLAHTTEALRGRNVPTGASEAVHQSIYRHYVFYRVFYNKKRVLYVILEYRTFVCFKSHSAAHNLSHTTKNNRCKRKTSATLKNSDL